eukprot:CAMPEP_0168362200 /NCGR_PEP_ID=MMETSP0228-20121227/3056_1 /TAXON_ID=133427 /ORGANISM="Protoceratium reticulatum, Strain CCCM 535 (=CCMP 1889)" /LENGTH=111 /DNA_ID=CAMNT_0008374895 /DNA_START=1 /DNA_END=332 /DNA_ORIENTATION=-
MQPLHPAATTLVVRNIPFACSQEELLREWPVDGSYNYLHLPYNAFRQRHSGYAYINFLNSRLAANFQERWHGRFLSMPFEKSLSVREADMQGWRPNLACIKAKSVVKLLET